MKIVSLWEPWATAMSLGIKKIETRSWRTNYRGPLLIQASKGGLSKKELNQEIDRLHIDPDLVTNQGCILAMVDLVACLPTDGTFLNLAGVLHPGKFFELNTPRERMLGNYDKGRFGWVTNDLFRLPEPMPIKGHQGLFDADREIITEVIRQRSLRR